MRFATTVIHAGQEPDPRTGAVTPPIYMTSTYSRKEQDEYAYARGANPTRDALQKSLAALESARRAQRVRQHVRIPGASEPIDAWRRPHGPQHDEVHRGSRRPSRRSAGDEPRRPPREAQVRPERLGCRAERLRLLAHAPWDQNPFDSHGEALRQRGSAREVP